MLGGAPLKMAANGQRAREMVSIIVARDEFSRTTASACARYTAMRVNAAAPALTLHVSPED
jgi:hypothetical protein